MRRDAEVAPKCLLRSLVIRKKKDSLGRALEATERRRKQGKKEELGEFGKWSWWVSSPPDHHGTMPVVR